MLLSPLVGESFGSPVVSAETVDSRFHQNESVLSVLVFSALLHVSSDIDSLFDEAVDVFGDFRSAT